MKFIKVESCRACPFIIYDDGKGMSSEFWKCGRYGIMLIDKDIYNATYNDLDTIHAECKLETSLTTREIELIDGMIEVHKSHAGRCDNIRNGIMAQKQKLWDLERVALLEKIKKWYGIQNQQKGEG